MTWGFPVSLLGVSARGQAAPEIARQEWFTPSRFRRPAQHAGTRYTRSRRPWNRRRRFACACRTRRRPGVRGLADELPDGVRIAGVDVGGLTPHAARVMLARRSARLARVPVTFVAGSRHFAVNPTEMGVTVDWGAQSPTQPDRATARASSAASAASRSGSRRPRSSPSSTPTARRSTTRSGCSDRRSTGPTGRRGRPPWLTIRDDRRRERPRAAARSGSEAARRVAGHPDAAPRRPARAGRPADPHDRAAEGGPGQGAADAVGARVARPRRQDDDDADAEAAGADARSCRASPMWAPALGGAAANAYFARLDHQVGRPAYGATFAVSGDQAHVVPAVDGLALDVPAFGRSRC